MAITYQDAWGNVVDTGAGSNTTLAANGGNCTCTSARADIEQEQHYANDFSNDTGAKFASNAALTANHVYHQSVGAPR